MYIVQNLAPANWIVPAAISWSYGVYFQLHLDNHHDRQPHLDPEMPRCNQIIAYFLVHLAWNSIHTVHSRYNPILMSPQTNWDSCSPTSSTWTRSGFLIPVQVRHQRWRKKKTSTKLSHIRIRIEHTIGVLKARFSCLRSLPVGVNSSGDLIGLSAWVM